MERPPGPGPLSGECMVGVVRCHGADGLPPGLHALPGPGLVLAARYDDSPVGPYLELAVTRPARLGPRIGMCVTTMVVTTPESRVWGRTHWGLPKELGALEWTDDDDTRVVRWVERDLVLRATPAGPAFPAVVPFRLVQRRSDGPVGATAHLRGRARAARVEVTVPGDDPLAALAGSHLGTVVASARLVMGQACPSPAAPRMARASARSAPEPALSWGPDSGD